MPYPSSLACNFAQSVSSNLVRLMLFQVCMIARKVPEDLKNAMIGEYNRRGCNSKHTRWSVQDQHRFVCAHLHRCTESQKTQADDWGLFSRDLPSAGADGTPPPLPDFVIQFEEAEAAKANQAAASAVATEEPTDGYVLHGGVVMPKAGYRVDKQENGTYMLSHPDMPAPMQLKMSANPYQIYATRHGQCLWAPSETQESTPELIYKIWVAGIEAKIAPRPVEKETVVKAAPGVSPASSFLPGMSSQGRSAACRVHRLLLSPWFQMPSQQFQVARQ